MWFSFITGAVGVSLQLVRFGDANTTVPSSVSQLLEISIFSSTFEGSGVNYYPMLSTVVSRNMLESDFLDFSDYTCGGAYSY